MRKSKPGESLEKAEVVQRVGGLAVIQEDLRSMQTQLDHFFRNAWNAPSDTFDTSGIFEVSNELEEYGDYLDQLNALREAIRRLTAPQGQIQKYLDLLSARYQELDKEK